MVMIKILLKSYLMKKLSRCLITEEVFKLPKCCVLFNTGVVKKTGQNLIKIIGYGRARTCDIPHNTGPVPTL